MKKLFALLILALLMVLTLTSCDDFSSLLENPTEKATIAHTHDIVADAAVSPTCTKAGLTDGFHCATCGAILLAQETIAASHSWDNGAITTEPTCTKKGVKTFECTACDEAKTEDVAATGIHNYNDEEKCTMCQQNIIYTSGLEFELLSDKQSYKVCGIGTAKEAYIAIPKSHNNLPVTQIDTRAFYNSEITSVRIPNTIVSIGINAFYSCSNLTSVEMIGNSVTSIGNNAFYGCQALSNITIPDSVITIGEGAFFNCKSLKNVTIPNSITSIANAMFADCSQLTSVTIPDSITSIGNNAFYNCNKLANLTIPNSVTNIGNYAFFGCNALTNVTMPNSITSIGKNVFCSCSSLTSVTISNSVTSIEDYAFYGCKSLTNITISNSVTSIGKEAFFNCTTLTTITIPNSVTSIGSDAFSGAGCEKNEHGIYYVDTWLVRCEKNIEELNIRVGTKGIAKNAFRDCDNLAIVTIPDSITSISDGAFESCDNIRILTIPDSIISIGNDAFSGCSDLTNITIPNNVTDIGNNAFKWCNKMTKITIPNSVTNIGDSAFSNCKSLTEITYNGTKAAWKSITKGDSWNSDTGNYTVHCTDGDVAKS